MIDQLIKIRNTEFPWVAVHVSFVVCDQNRHEVHHFVEQWRNRGIRQVWLHPLNNRAGLVSDSARSTDMDKLERDYRGDQTVVVDVLRTCCEADGLCKVARSFNFISADGHMRLCSMDYGRKTVYGNIADNSLQDAYYNKLQAFLCGFTSEICKDCDFYPKMNLGSLSKSANPVRTVNSATMEQAVAGGLAQ